MSTPKKPLPAKLIISIIFQGDPSCRETAALQEVLQSLAQQFGPMDFQSPVTLFTHTSYYNREMGELLLRKFVSFKALVERDRLAEIKLFTNEVEKRHADSNGRRGLNIDPGLLSPENLILASGKNFTHRIYLQKGIFAEVTLLYQNKQFTTLPWTYPDYASREVTSILTRMRELLLADLKHLKA